MMKKFFLVILFIFVGVPFLFAEDDIIFRIKDVVFEGLQNVKPKTVRSEIQLKKGKVYATSLAREDLRTILGLGYFEDASLSVDKENKIVKFKVIEKPYIKNIVFKGNKQFDALFVNVIAKIFHGFILWPKTSMYCVEFNVFFSRASSVCCNNSSVVKVGIGKLRSIP